MSPVCPQSLNDAAAAVANELQANAAFFVHLHAPFCADAPQRQRQKQSSTATVVTGRRAIMQRPRCLKFKPQNKISRKKMNKLSGMALLLRRLVRGCLWKKKQLQKCATIPDPGRGSAALLFFPRFFFVVVMRRCKRALRSVYQNEFYRQGIDWRQILIYIGGVASICGPFVLRRAYFTTSAGASSVTHALEPCFQNLR